jgi:hypothetical protein
MTSGSLAEGKELGSNLFHVAQSSLGDPGGSGSFGKGADRKPRAAALGPYSPNSPVGAGDGCNGPTARARQPPNWIGSALALVRPQQAMASNILASPHGEPGPIIDGVDYYHRIRVRERYPPRQPGLGRRLDDGIV